MYSEVFLAFFPLVKFLLIAPLCCLGDLLLFYLISLSRSLFGHLLFRQGLTSANAVQIWQRLDNKSTPSWQLENTVHNLRENVCDSHEYSTASKATVLNWVCYRPRILHWTTNCYPTQQQNCLSYKRHNMHNMQNYKQGMSQDIYTFGNQRAGSQRTHFLFSTQHCFFIVSIKTCTNSKFLTYSLHLAHETLFKDTMSSKKG